MQIRYPPELPVSRRRDEIAAAIRDHQVVVVAGETGSGKTTQLPKICLELGLAERGVIAHTQPRRIAARSVAERVADELASTVGDLVGYTVRFTDQVGRDTRVRLMTDGILLAQIQRDPDLAAYSVIIVDEAHERSLNIDFLLGYLRQLTARRPELKVVITSATIDSQRFAEHFSGPGGKPAPVIEVSGRTYPVEIRYRPMDPVHSDSENRDQVAAICDAVDELCTHGPGDVLVFCSGEREIRDAVDAVAERRRDVEVVPLYGRLSAAEQHRIFAPHTGRRVVVATNVAETSLTVPGIHYVVDTGTARISRYSVRTKVQRLPIEPISRASATQRAGRCGRVADGICIRLYSQDDFESRPEFTDPEVLRTNLASVILQMAAAGLGPIESFPFLDAPDTRAIRDGRALLVELRAITMPDNGSGQKGMTTRLTGLGRRIARLPIDPRLAAMVVEADRRGCLHEVLVITAAMSIQDPRERPADQEAAADQAHVRFRHPQSDFLSWLNLWEYLRRQRKQLSGNAFRRMCRREYLHYLRVREWQDLHAQLRRVAKDLGLTMSRTAATGSDEATQPGELGVRVDAESVHRALLVGLLSQIGARDDREDQGRRRRATGGRQRQREYLGARGTRFAIFPGSGLARRPPEFVMAAELVETSRLWARTVAGIDPAWVEEAAGHLVTRSYAEPVWSARRGAAVATMSVTLYGVPLLAGRVIPLSRRDPATAREMFIRHALVQREWKSRHRFLDINTRLIEQAEELQHRARRRDLVIDDDALFAFYDARIPAGVTSAAHFDAWWKRRRRDHLDALTLTDEQLYAEHAAEVDPDAYPRSWSVGGFDVSVAYHFDPGHHRDGVTVQVPAQVLNQVPTEVFDWQVPGLRADLVEALIRSLPKAQRKHFAPAPDTARMVAAQLNPDTGSIGPALAAALTELRGTRVGPEDFDWQKVPDHLRVRVAVTDTAGQVVSEGRDPRQVGRSAAGAVTAAINEIATGKGLNRTGIRAFPSTGIPRTFSAGDTAGDITGYPALVWQPEHRRVDLLVLADHPAQREAMPAGVRHTLLAELEDQGWTPPGRAVTDGLSQADTLALARAPHAGQQELRADVLHAVVDQLVSEHGIPWQRAEADRLLVAIRDQAGTRCRDTIVVVARVLAAAREAEAALARHRSLAVLDATTDAKAHLDALVCPGFVTDAGVQRLPDVVRYVRGITHRVNALSDNPGRDARGRYDVHVATELYRSALAGADGAGQRLALAPVRWMLEELRVNQFAQGLGTRGPVSVQRIRKAIGAATS